MEKTIRKYSSRKAMKADELRCWQSRSAHERMDAVSELTTTAYALKGMATGFRLRDGPVVRLPLKGPNR